ncbi:MAG: hypothetical protein H0V54_10290 [Chthoniobacterales bacterium]|nr:hypothetical protein [Chthoniobacterales bacterium]
MSEEKSAPDLFDLKFLPAWVKETPPENRYADFAGEENAPPSQHDRRDRDRRGGGGGDRRDRGPRSPRGEGRGRDPRDRDRRPAPFRPPEERRGERPTAPAAPPPAVEVRFVPDGRVLENVLVQIKAGHLAYSVFSLARMFLDKPERYNVRFKSKGTELIQMGENGPVANDRRILENGAFLNQKDHFYRTEVTQSEPIKGNFTSVARCRLSGTLLGPTNHHAYQPQLRALYEQRFSRRMSFPEYQRQIEISSDPEAVERWKEEARSVTTYTTLQEEPPLTFPNAAETERHFRQTYLPGLLRSSVELTVDGVESRRLPDRSLGKLVENCWAQEFRSPTGMMQELIGALRQHGLHIFRHRKGMLFVSPVRARAFPHGSASVSSSVGALLTALSDQPGINRKQLLEHLQPNEPETAEGAEKRKLALASDLHWLIGEGHVIEFNDGALDLPRMKPPAPAQVVGPNGQPGTTVAPNESSGEPLAATAETAPSVSEEAPMAVAENVPVAAEESRADEGGETSEKIPAAD